MRNVLILILHSLFTEILLAPHKKVAGLLGFRSSFGRTILNMVNQFIAMVVWRVVLMVLLMVVWRVVPIQSSRICKNKILISSEEKSTRFVKNVLPKRTLKINGTIVDGFVFNDHILTYAK